MNWFYNLKIARKLAFGFGLCLLLNAVVVTVAIVRMREMNSISKSIISDSVVGLLAMQKMQGSISQYRIVEFKYITSASESDKAQAAADLEKNRAEAEAGIQRLRRVHSLPAGQAKSGGAASGVAKLCQR